MILKLSVFLAILALTNCRYVPTGSVENMPRVPVSFIDIVVTPKSQDQTTLQQEQQLPVRYNEQFTQENLPMTQQYQTGGVGMNVPLGQEQLYQTGGVGVNVPLGQEQLYQTGGVGVNVPLNQEQQYLQQLYPEYQQQQYYQQSPMSRWYQWSQLPQQQSGYLGGGVQWPSYQQYQQYLQSQLGGQESDLVQQRSLFQGEGSQFVRPHGQVFDSVQQRPTFQGQEPEVLTQEELYEEYFRPTITTTPNPVETRPHFSEMLVIIPTNEQGERTQRLRPITV